MDPKCAQKQLGCRACYAAVYHILHWDTTQTAGSGNWPGTLFEGERQSHDDNRAEVANGIQQHVRVMSIKKMDRADAKTSRFPQEIFVIPNGMLLEEARQRVGGDSAFFLCGRSFAPAYMTVHRYHCD